VFRCGASFRRLALDHPLDRLILPSPAGASIRRSSHINDPRIHYLMVPWMMFSAGPIFDMGDWPTLWVRSTSAPRSESARTSSG